MVDDTADARPFTARHQLYRLYDASGDLLYIGRTNSVGQRFDGHARKQPWWHEVVDCKIELLPDFDTLAKAERIAIEQEAPRYNKQHNEDWPWLKISERVNAAADFLHRDCSEPGVGPCETNPCRRCFRKAAWLLSYSDAQVDAWDQGVMDAMALTHDWDRKAVEMWRGPFPSVRAMSEVMFKIGWHPCLIVSYIRGSIAEEKERRAMLESVSDEEDAA